MAFNRDTLTTINAFKKTRDELRRISKARKKEQHWGRSMLDVLDEAVEDIAKKESERLNKKVK